MVTRPTALTKDHDVSQFVCSKPVLSDWLKRHALQSDQSRHTKTMVISTGNARVIGYYSFNIVSVEHGAMTPSRVSAGLAQYSIPIFLIARLAVDQQFEGQKLGSGLMYDALTRAAILSKHIRIRAIVVDALDEEAKHFYSRFDFQPWPADGLRMWLMMKDLLKTFEQSNGSLE